MIRAHLSPDRSKTLCRLAVVALALLSAGCSGAGYGGRVDLTDFAWPAGDPRVQLVELIEPRIVPGGGAGTFFRRLVGKHSVEALERPYGVAWDGETLLVTDPGGGRVARVASGGRVTDSNRGALTGPLGIAVCSAGIVVSDSREGRVVLLSPRLEALGTVGEGLDRPTGVVCDGDRILVVETGRHRVLVFEPTAGTPAEAGWASTAFGSRGDGNGELNFPTTLALDRGSLWVGDTLNFRLQRFDPATGTYLGDFGHLGDAPGEMPRIKGVAIDSGGNLWVSDAHLDQVSLFAPDGTFLLGLGGPGSDPGRFSFPAGVAAHPDGRVAVVDSLNHRIQIFRLIPRTTRELE